MNASALKIKILGIGGAGCNLADYLHTHYTHELCKPEVHLIDTDIRALSTKSCPNKLNIGHSLLRGFSSGGDTTIAHKAIQADLEPLEALSQDTDIIILLTGLGAGTGSAASPFVASLAKKSKAHILSFALTPFAFEGPQKASITKSALNALQKHSHSTISLSNDLLLQKLDPTCTVLDSFAKATEHTCVLLDSLIDTVERPALINLDQQSLKTIFPNPGAKTLFAFSQGQGENAVQQAINSIDLCPFLHTPNAQQTANSILVSITGGPNLNLNDVKTISQTLTTKFKAKDNTAINASFDPNLGDVVKITVLGATYTGRSSSTKTTQANTNQSGGFYQPALFPIPGANSQKNKRPQKTLSNMEDFDDRGYFAHTEDSTYNGQQLDIPTYLRRGIRINL